MGRNKINITEMFLGRLKKGKKTYATAVINTDSEISKPVRAKTQKS